MSKNKKKPLKLIKNDESLKQKKHKKKDNKKTTETQSELQSSIGRYMNKG